MKSEIQKEETLQSNSLCFKDKEKALFFGGFVLGLLGSVITNILVTSMYRTVDHLKLGSFTIDIICFFVSFGIIIGSYFFLKKKFKEWGTHS